MIYSDGVDFQETFSFVAKMDIFRILLSYATNLDWELQRFDVKNAVLREDLEEEVHMEISPRFDIEQSQGMQTKESLEDFAKQLSGKGDTT